MRGIRKNINHISNKVNTMEQIMENTIRDNYWDITDYSDTNHSLYTKSELYISSRSGIRGRSKFYRKLKPNGTIRIMRG